MNNRELDQYLKNETQNKKNFDIVRGEVGVNKKYVVYYASSLIDVKLLQLIYQLMETDNSTYFGNKDYSNNIKEIIIAIFSGLLFVIPLDNNEKAFLVETRNYPTRGISEPETEKTIRGSKDGFCESIIVNVGLIRRRIRSPHLIFEKYQIGSSSNEDVVVTYLDNRVDHKYLRLIKEKIILNKNKIDSLVMGDKALEQILFDQKYSIYPLVKYSERPDVIAIELLKGRIAIIVDNSCSALITPTNIFEQIRHVEEYQQTPFVGSFLRITRLIAIIFSMFFIPLWIALIKDNDLSSFFIIPKETNFTKIFFQVIIVEIVIEILRIATIHTPSKLSSTMGLISALIIGQFAVESGIFIKEIILYSCLSAFGGFATPSYELSLANKIIKIIMIIFCGILGKIGFVVSLFLLFIYLATVKINGYSYLYPLIPFDKEEFLQIFSRFGKSTKKRVR